MSNHCKTIVVTGGIVSGIGKGITAASIGRLLIDMGYKVTPVKADPYLNQDAGTMNPLQHGEVFVTDDGAETDLDLGHYERFLDVNLNRYSNFTSGSVYRAVMDLERDGEYLGKTIQIIPHVTDEIKRRLLDAEENSRPDFLICELGGTVGDIEALPFLEAIRQYKSERPDSTIFVHVVKIDYLFPSDEGKTKPIQHSVTNLRSYGIQPDILIVRCKRPLTKEEHSKLALFTGVKSSQVIPAIDARNLYEIPAHLQKFGLREAILHSFGTKPPILKKTLKPAWEELYSNLAARRKSVKIGLVGKYLDQDDAYLSILEAIRHAGIYYRTFTEIVPVNAEANNITELVKDLHGVIVPGGFGLRGIEGKIQAIQTVRENKIPFLGICLGLQTAVIEIARHLAELPQANSSEFMENCDCPVVDILPDQANLKRKGGTMRLGQYEALLEKGSLAEKLYRTYRPEEISNHFTVKERHRHRYEVNPQYHQKLKDTGLLFSGVSPDGSLVEFIELPQNLHPYFIATQAHPEFRSRPHRPHPLFAGLIEAALNQ